MKDIEGGLLFILLIAFAGIHGEMMFSGLGWNISREATNDPWSAQCVYYYNARLFTLKSAIGNPCPLRLNHTLATGSKSFTAFISSAK
jgi:hypothetical protein